MFAAKKRLILVCMWVGIFAFPDAFSERINKAMADVSIINAKPEQIISITLPSTEKYVWQEVYPYSCDTFCNAHYDGPAQFYQPDSSSGTLKVAHFILQPKKHGYLPSTQDVWQYRFACKKHSTKQQTELEFVKTKVTNSFTSGEITPADVLERKTYWIRFPCGITNAHHYYFASIGQGVYGVLIGNGSWGGDYELTFLPPSQWQYTLTFPQEETSLKPNSTFENKETFFSSTPPSSNAFTAVKIQRLKLISLASQVLTAESQEQSLQKEILSKLKNNDARSAPPLALQNKDTSIAHDDPRRFLQIRYRARMLNGQKKLVMMNTVILISVNNNRFSESNNYAAMITAYSNTQSFTQLDNFLKKSISAEDVA